MEELRIRFSPERIDELEVDTWIALKEKRLTDRAARDLAIVFVTDGNGSYMPEEEARKLIGRLKLRQLGELFNTLADAIEDEEVPPANGG